MSKPYVNEAMVGNKRLLAAFSADGELQRCWWPSVDFGQHIARVRLGVAVGDGEVRWLDGDPDCRLNYVHDTNILTIEHRIDNLIITRTAFAAPGVDALVQRMELTGPATTLLPAADTSAVVFSDYAIYEQPRYQATRFDAPNGLCIHYFRDVYIAVGFLEGPVDRYRAAPLPAGDLNLTALDGLAAGLGSQSCLAKAVHQESNQATAAVTVCTTFGHTLSACMSAFATARNDGYDRLFAAAQADAHQLLAAAIAWPPGLAKALDAVAESSAAHDSTAGSPLPPGTAGEAIYARSLLTFHLLQGESGAMIAAPEFDESFSRCGGYAYCWGRDAAFIVTALDRVGMSRQVDEFHAWALGVQEEDGLWEHRHFTNGQLAPSWGIQLDETASLLWGMALQGQRKLTDEAHTRSVLPALARAADKLMEFVDPVTGLLMASVDLWEERVAEHVYSTTAAAAALREFARLCRAVDEHDGAVGRTRPPVLGRTVQAWATCSAEVASRLSERIHRCVAETHGGFLRSRLLTIDKAEASRRQAIGEAVQMHRDAYAYDRYALCEDAVIDVSLLGLSVPFDVVAVDHPVMRTTAQLVESRLAHRSGGIGRYEGDPYIGGNPWVLATLWLALYKLRAGDEHGSLRLVLWAIQHASQLGFLPEQIDRDTGRIAWVNPLAWSHAMFVWYVTAWLERSPAPAAAAAAANP